MFQEAKISPFQTFSVCLRYWSRADCDGTVAGLKVAVDTLRAEGYAVNDDKRYFLGMSITPDPTLAHNTYELTIRVHS